MGRMGIGPDEGDGGFPWSCPRCNYPNPGGASNCMDCGFGGSSHPTGMYVTHSHECSCPIHGTKPIKYPKEKPLTAKQKAANKKRADSFMKDIDLTFHPDPKVRDKHWKNKVKHLRALGLLPPPITITADGYIIFEPEKKVTKRKKTAKKKK